MSAPLQRRPWAGSPPHGARTAEALHQLRRCRALASGKATTKPRARLQGVRRNAAQGAPAKGGCFGEEILCISVSPAFTDSGSASLFLNPQELGNKESGSSWDSVLLRCFCLPKDKSKHICFTREDLFCCEVSGQPTLGYWDTPSPEPERAGALQVLLSLGCKEPAAAYGHGSCLPSVGRDKFT